MMAQLSHVSQVPVRMHNNAVELIYVSFGAQTSVELYQDTPENTVNHTFGALPLVRQFDRLARVGLADASMYTSEAMH
jgi:hypothetical protein